MNKENLADLIANDYDSFKKFHNTDETMEISEVEFTNLNLSGANLSNIDFSGSSFIESGLTNVNFTGCNLTSVDFSRATLVECNFSDCILNGTNFSYATVNYCDFNDADLAGANFCETDLSDSDLATSVNLDSVRFDVSTVWPQDDKLPEDFDCAYKSDLSSLNDEDDSSNETY